MHKRMQLHRLLWNRETSQITPPWLTTNHVHPNIFSHLLYSWHMERTMCQKLLTKATNKQGAKVIAKALLQHIIPRWDIAGKICSNDTAFVSTVLKDVRNYLGFEIKKTSLCPPSHHCRNGGNSIKHLVTVGVSQKKGILFKMLRYSFNTHLFSDTKYTNMWGCNTIGDIRTNNYCK